MINRTHERYEKSYRRERHASIIAVWELLDADATETGSLGIPKYPTIQG